MPDANQPKPNDSVRHPVLVVLWLALAAGYLLTSATGMHVSATAIVSVMAGAFLIMSGRVVAGVILGAVLVASCVYFSRSMQFIIYVPPMAAFAFMAFFFYRTLGPGGEALITRVARKEHPDLPADMESYTRSLTWTWTICFLMMFATSLLLVPFLSIDTWMRVIHGLGYLFPTSLFLVEYIYRHYRFPDRRHGSLKVLIPNIVQVTREVAMSRPTREREAGR